MMKPSSATAGFFQEQPSLPNQFYDDASFQRTLRRKSRTPDTPRHPHAVLRIPYSVSRFSSWSGGERRDTKDEA